MYIHGHSKIAITLLVIAIACIGLTAAQPGRSRSRSRSPGSRRPPEPVEVNVTCEGQKMRSRHISCEPDGSFSPIQCQGRKCHCVDRATGERLRPVEHRLRNEFNCSAAGVVTCRELRCGPRVCSAGYRNDEDGCPTCTCESPPPPVECQTIQEILDDGSCHCSCIEFEMPQGKMPRGGPEKDECPVCNETCNAEMPDEDSCVTSSTSCMAGRELRVVGRHGRPECVENLEVDADCMVREEPEPPGRRPRGSRDRETTGNIAQITASCQNGSSCVQTGVREYKCSPDSTSPCKTARMSDPNINCDRMGKFEPLQCTPVNTTSTDDRSRSDSSRRDPMDCRCVEVNTGATIMGTEVRTERSRRPNCRPRNCMVPAVRGRGRGRRQRTFRVKHGETYIDTANCRSCQCSDGDPTAFCSVSATGMNCESITEQRNCTLEDGFTIAHGETQTIDCELCGCSNGRVGCVTDEECRNNRETDTGVPVVRNMCEECRLQQANPVCGPDGRNHITRCAAVHCAGIPEVDLADGPCQSVDVCELHPCNNTRCIPTGGVACVGNNGCEPDQLRTCVDLDNLQCTSTSNETEPDAVDLRICGSDGNTYESICRFLQTTVDVQIVHSGACESEECNFAGEVCGSDGVTYPNLCVLRSRSVTRLDYVGSCVTNGTIEENCMLVRDRGLCRVNTDNCDSIYQPGSGCCPICGGSVTIALDRDAITVAASIDFEVQSVDYIVTRILDLFIEIICSVEISITDTSNIEISLTSDNETVVSECISQVQEIADAVNGVSTETVGVRKRQAPEESVPQVYDFTIVASTAPQVLAEDTTTDSPIENTTGRANSLHLGLGALSLVVFGFLSLLIA